MNVSEGFRVRRATAVVRAEGTDYGLGLQCSPTANKNIDPKGRAKVPLELEDMPLPLNTFKNKEPFTGKVSSDDGQTATLCVRRATYWDPEMNAEDPAKRGIC